jgi:hypothetical protein
MEVKREEAVHSGMFECPGGCGLVMKVLTDGTMQCQSPRCSRKGVRYRKPTAWLEIVESNETCSESETNDQTQTTSGGEHQQR